MILYCRAMPYMYTYSYYSTYVGIYSNNNIVRTTAHGNSNTPAPDFNSFDQSALESVCRCSCGYIAHDRAPRYQWLVSVTLFVSVSYCAHDN